MRKLIDYIIKEPIINSPNRGYKFPFVSGEILSCEANFISDKFFQQEPEDRVSLEKNISNIFSLSDSFNIAVLDDEGDHFGSTREDLLRKDNGMKDQDLFNPRKDSGNQAITREDLLRKDSGMKDQDLFTRKDSGGMKEQDLFNPRKDSGTKDQDLFNPPDIEYGHMETIKENKEREFKEKESKDISLNAVNLFIKFEKSLDYKKNENLELLDYLFSFLSSNTNNDLNHILAGYFSKVLISLLKTKSSQLMRYICIKKPENLVNLLNQVKNRSICDFIIKILLYESNTNNLEESVNFDNIKLNILNKLILCTNKDDISNVQDLFFEFFENTKNLDTILTERFLTNISNHFVNKNFNVFREILVIAKELMIHYKIEFEKAQRFMSSMSMSIIFMFILFRIQ